jgi:hypothetical protein
MRNPGTIKWLEAVNAFTDDVLRYPEWNDIISQSVKNKLALDNGIHTYSVFRDDEANPCLSIQDGLWVPADDKEHIGTTKVQSLSWATQASTDQKRHATTQCIWAKSRITRRLGET